MRKGFLSEYFEGVVAKRLSAVEADPGKSNQHEFNGVEALRHLLGKERQKNRPARFIWLGEENEGFSEDSLVTWYDAREDQRDRTAEYRLYFKANNPVMELASEGDLLIVAKRPGNELMIVVVPKGSTIENQLLWLFGISPGIEAKFEFNEFARGTDTKIDFAARFILDELAIEIEEPEADKLDSLLVRFKGVFPSTKIFSAFARETLPEVNPVDSPDKALLAWMNQEEKLFRRLERHIVADQLKKGFVAADEVDVDGFIGFSLSVQNRRKARVGFALENHLEQIFRAHDVRYSRGAVTENNAKPDFLFPGDKEYHDKAFPEPRLSMLGVKSSCKDRWRQVLSEAARIQVKHLLTLEPGISENQTEEMSANRLQLVLPKGIHETYRERQQAWLMDVGEFIKLVHERQI